MVKSVTDYITEGYQRISERLWFWIALTLVYILLTTAFSIIASKFKYAGNLISYLFDAFVGVGFIYAFLKGYGDEHVEISDLFSGASYYVNYIIANILYALLVMVGIILFIVPGIIWAVKYQFYKYYIIDDKCSAIEALQRSASLTEGYRWDIFCFDILVGLINFVGVLALVVGILFSIPMTAMAEVALYKGLRQMHDGVPSADSNAIA